MTHQVIRTTKAPNPIVPYNQAIAARGQFVFVSGQIPLSTETGQIIGTENIVQQTQQVMANIEAILTSARMNWNNVVKTTGFMSDLTNFYSMNEVYAQYFDESTAPARVCVEVSRLPKDVLIEIECIAVID
jgi:2-iminobutanoate/2-iminopropanoate deaminase